MITSRALWAKLERDDAGNVVRWHSLVDHSADVAAVLEALLDQPTIAARLARLAGRSKLDATTCVRLAALAFLHDIGKANRGFRARVDHRMPPVGHIDQFAWLFSEAADDRRLDRLWSVLGFERIETWFVDDPKANLLAAVFAHHGRPWVKDSAPVAHLWTCGVDGDPIADLAPMREAIDRWFPRAFEDGPPLPGQPAFHHAFAGLLMLADWLGSDTSFFPLACGSGTDRLTFARAQARVAMAEVGLHVETRRSAVRASSLSFADVFDVGGPRPLQTAVTGPDAGLLVLEAETGSGKTEAALWRFKHLFEHGAVDGLMFALPTRVAATSMFARVKRFRDRVFGAQDRPAVLLAVPGQQALDEAGGRPLPGFGFEWTDDPNNEVRRARWAAERPKRFLAAQIVVGTVDQALLGAIRVKHAHLRGAALLRHLLVVDEVHASDRYMADVLTSLLRDHAAAGGHALLLSATLGAELRSKVLGAACLSPAEAELVPYPALSWADGGRECRQAVQDAGREKAVRLRPAPLIDRPEDVARLALEAARGGAAVLVIRNTVGAAVATAQALEALAGSDHPALFRVGEAPTLHHGRFAPSDRLLLDAAVEAVMGKARSGGGRVVVGTQTLEQSLDLDADFLITDLCPVDVLLQRIGRLHRHAERIRPSGFGIAETVVLVTACRDLLPLARQSRHGLGKYVYDDLRSIEASWRLIEKSPEWRIPAMNRRLVEQATHPTRLNTIAAELKAADPDWFKAEVAILGKNGAYGAAAGYARLDRNQSFSKLSIEAGDGLATRLGARDRIATLPMPQPGPFGRDVTALKLPSHWLEGVPDDAEPAAVVCTGDGITFSLGAREFRYDRFGLRPR